MRTTDLRLSDYDLQLVVGATGEEFSMRETATAKDVHLRATLAWPDDLSLAGFKQALEDGRFVEVVMASGTSSATVSSANEGVLSGSTKSGASEATFRLDRAGLAFVGTVNALEYDVSSPGLPRSLTKIAKAAFDVLLPITRTEGPQKFVYTIDLDGLEIGDELWALFDPGHALPRDPATVIVDLRGTATTLTDVFAIGAGAAMPEPPFKIDTASLARLRIDAAGAQLAGTGNIVFDYEDDTFVPSGSGDFTLTGGNALLDTLVRIGALPAEQASSARMMLGLLARPGKGDDTLISKIEARDGGRIVANGQPLN